jgi:hypothetical protein
MWLYGSGFPKSHNLAVVIDKQAGALADRGIGFTTAGYTKAATVPGGAHGAHKAITDEAQTWQGWGTALKPAWEPIIVAMKPLDGTFAQNALKHGVAGLNIDGGRIGTEVLTQHGRNDSENRSMSGRNYAEAAGRAWTGRWPANLILDEDAAQMLDEQSGTLTSSELHPWHDAKESTGWSGGSKVGRIKRSFGGNSGGASRFFYVAKASRSEREKGLEGMELREHGAYANGKGMPGRTLKDGEWVQTGTWDEPNRNPARNHHPTVKPLALMRYLCTLTATPTSGVVLDPFAGSGTTGVACVETGRDFIGIELDADYIEIAQKRIDFAQAQLRNNPAQPDLFTEQDA